MDRVLIKTTLFGRRHVMLAGGQLVQIGEQRGPTWVALGVFGQGDDVTAEQRRDSGSWYATRDVAEATRFTEEDAAAWVLVNSGRAGQWRTFNVEAVP